MLLPPPAPCWSQAPGVSCQAPALGDATPMQMCISHGHCKPASTCSPAEKQSECPYLERSKTHLLGVLQKCGKMLAIKLKS